MRGMRRLLLLFPYELPNLLLAQLVFIPRTYLLEDVLKTVEDADLVGDELDAVLGDVRPKD